MKQFVVTGLLLLVFYCGYAQRDTLSIKQIMALKAKPPVAGISYELGGANSRVPFASLIDLALSDFLNEQQKDEILSRTGNGLRFGYWQSLDISYEQPAYYTLDAYTPGSYFHIENQLFTGSRLTDNGLRLFLNGNKQFAGQEVELGPSQFESWWYTNLKYRYEALLDSIPYKLDVGIVVGHEYSAYDVRKASIFTESNGEYLDADLEYVIRETRSNSPIPFGGLGMATGFEISMPLRDQKYRLDFKIEDLGVVFWSGLEETRVDSAFRFRGANFESIFDLNDSLVAAERDRIQNGFFNGTTDGYAALMPFNVNFRFAKPCKDAKYLKELYALAEYRYLTAYIPRLGVGSLWHFNPRHILRGELTYGGFNTLALGVSYQLTLAERYRFTLGSQNILAWALPGIFTGSSVGVGAYYIF